MNLRTLKMALLATALALVAQGAPKPGEKAPAFSLKTLAGNSVDLSTLTGKSPVVLIVLRGFPGYQCPLCTRQVNEYVTKANEFAAQGARVVMVYPGPAAELQKRAGEFLANKEWPADWVFLLDPDYALTNAYGLRWDAPKETAYPATFVVNRDGTVKWSKVSKTHGGRATAAEVLAVL